MFIEDQKYSLLTLTFKNSELETSFTYENTKINVNFIRFGISISFLGWIVVCVLGNKYFYNDNLNDLFLTIYFYLFPLFVINFLITFVARLYKTFHLITSLSNLSAGIFVILIFLFAKDYGIYLLAFFEAITFFAFFILRIKFKYAFFCTSFYTLSYLLLLFLTSFSNSIEKISMIVSILILFPTCSFGGYLLEFSDRKIFIINKIIDMQKNELQVEKEKSEYLLLNVLPFKIAQRLKENSSTIADTYNEVTVLFADIVGFTKMSASMSAEEVVNFLNTIFNMFDDLVIKYKIEKIKTIGDAYMVAAGVPNKIHNHAQVIIKLAIELINAVKNYNKEHKKEIMVRIGVNSGPIVAGVIGKMKFLFDLWGDTVNTASRMESNGLPNKIQVTEKTYELVKNDYSFESRGEIDIKGKGQLKTYILKSNMDER